MKIMVCKTSLLSLIVINSFWLTGCTSVNPTSLDPVAYFSGPQIKGDPLVAYEKTQIKTEKIAALKLVSYQVSTGEASSAKLAQFLAKEQHPMLRADLIRKLSDYPTAKAELALKLSMEDPSAIVRTAGCEAWVKRNSAKSIEILKEVAVSDTDVDVRIAAVKGLAKIGDENVLDTLKITLEDRDPAVQLNTMVTLRKITGRNYQKDVGLWKDYLNGKDPQEPAFSITKSIYGYYRSI